MYEDKTYSSLLQDALSDVGGGVQTGEGYLVYNALSALAYTNKQLKTSTIFKQEFNTNKHLGEYTNRELSSYMEVALMTQRVGG